MIMQARAQALHASSSDLVEENQEVTFIHLADFSAMALATFSSANTRINDVIKNECGR